MKRIPQLLSLAAGFVLAATGATAQVQGAFWAFQDANSPTSVGSTTVNVNTFAAVPVYSRTGSILAVNTSGGAPNFTDFQGTLWNQPRQNQVWAQSMSGSTGNSFTVSNLDFTSLNSVSARFDLAVVTNGAPGDSFTATVTPQYSLNGVDWFAAGSPVNQGSTISNPATYVAQTFDLSSITAINGQSGVSLRFQLSDVAASGFVRGIRIDNLQVTAVPEPGAVGAGLAVAALAVAAWRRRAVRG